MQPDPFLKKIIATSGGEIHSTMPTAENAFSDNGSRPSSKSMAMRGLVKPFSPGLSLVDVRTTKKTKLINLEEINERFAIRNDSRERNLEGIKPKKLNLSSRNRPKVFQSSHSKQEA
jgi:hypothetical protein